MKTVIEMAREAGLLVIETADGGEAVYTWPQGITDELERFSELVRADAIAQEREACVKAADDQWVRDPNVSGGDAIRSRSSEH